MSRARAAAGLLGLLGGLSATGMGWLVTMIVAFGRLRGGDDGTWAAIGLGWILGGALGVAGGLRLRRSPRTGTPLLALGGALAAAPVLVGAWAALVPATLLVAGAALAILGPARETRGVPQAQRGVSEPGGAVPGTDGARILILDVDVPDPESPAVRRLVLDAAARRFREVPALRWVEVRSRSGTVLGLVPRLRKGAPEVAVPGQLRMPRRRRRAGPDPAAHAEDAEPLPREGRRAPVVALPPGEAHPLADRFELPPEVRARLRDPNDPVDLVRAILEAAGLAVEVRGDVLVAGDRAVAVVGGAGVGFADRRVLNHAYLRLSEVPAARRMVVSLRVLDPADVRRREWLAPDVSHAGPDAIQRMADAVALGADPLRFVLAPAVAEPAASGA